MKDMATILVVDDEIGIRELLTEILHDEGHIVEIAANAREARDCRLRGAPDLVLLDIWMPDTDGMTLLKEWASQGQLTIPVIMMSDMRRLTPPSKRPKSARWTFWKSPSPCRNYYGQSRKDWRRACAGRKRRPLAQSRYQRFSGKRRLPRTQQRRILQSCACSIFPSISLCGMRATPLSAPILNIIWRVRTAVGRALQKKPVSNARIYTANSSICALGLIKIKMTINPAETGLNKNLSKNCGMTPAQ